MATLIKQLKESVESIQKGGRPELAEKEWLEIRMIEAYLPQAAAEEEIRKLVRGVIAHVQKDAGGVRPGGRRIWGLQCRWLSNGFEPLAYIPMGSW